jgi:demethylspheroidene O-methyltransferase
MLFDLPEVAARAEGRLAGRARIVGGKVPADPLPKGADCISFVRVLHDHDDEDVVAMLRRAAEALPPGGQILVAEPMAGEGGAAALGDVYFRLYMRAMGRGRPRSPAEIMGLLRSIGCKSVQQHFTPNPYAAQIVSGCLD